MTKKIFAKRLKQARKNRKYSQKNLGIRVGLSDKTISIYEKGGVYPPIDNLLRITKELNIKVSDLLDD